MGERKVINKYYPADFDPSKLPRGPKRNRDQQKVRVMLPMTVCCNTCHEFIYKGKKFNSRKETVEGVTYLGIKIFRFYIKCTKCSAEITFRTDPEHSDYQAEFGATRNYEPNSWRTAAENEKERSKKKDSHEMDAIALLEERTQKRRDEMDDIEKLDELKMMSGRQEGVGLEQVLAARRYHEASMEQADEEELASIVFGGPETEATPSAPQAIPITKAIVKKVLPSKKKAKLALSVRPAPSNDLSSLLGMY
jgi:hypothetical protein